ncbi:MAG TPA: ArsA-related P-loop ATPase [Segeticoccus sp.]|uniref:ArsA-related P-loop ATPase n=1 Tax=Segeticoccus sp. TaxID=2706531 RepID=UPI002D81165E|nr:ArsA-related P-loop ATPase [Segeticoccus sp.]HET8599001.1 ArsA-related P-loop ATPase [Segeticoccus sp.]
MSSGDWPDVRLHVVTGKGGTGKTTVAAALALALAERGQRVLLVEVEGRQGIAQLLDVDPLPDREVRITRTAEGGELWGLAVDAKAALMEYLQSFYKLGRAGGVLEKFGAVDFATTIAPGVRDVLLIGKVYEAARRAQAPTSRHGGPVHDAVVLDAPPTGRIGRFLGVGTEVAGLAKVGPIHKQAQSITRLLRSSRCAVHLVTVPEEMPVQETIDAVAELHEQRLPIGGIVVNQVRDHDQTEAALATVAPDGSESLSDEDLATDLKSAGLRTGPTLVGGLRREAADLAARALLEQQELDRVLQLGRPTYELPLLPEGVEAGEVRFFARVLAEEGMA